MNHFLLPDSFKIEGCHEFAVCMISRFAIARPLTLALFGFLQCLLLTVNQLNIPPSNIEHIHEEFVETLMNILERTDIVHLSRLWS